MSKETESRADSSDFQFLASSLSHHPIPAVYCHSLLNGLSLDTPHYIKVAPLFSKVLGTIGTPKHPWLFRPFLFLIKVTLAAVIDKLNRQPFMPHSCKVQCRCS